MVKPTEIRLRVVFDLPDREFTVPLVLDRVMLALIPADQLEGVLRAALGVAAGAMLGVVLDALEGKEPPKW